MRYVSTSNRNLTSDLHEAVCGSTASDGGLLLPERIPHLPEAFFKNLGEMTLTEIAYVIFTSFLGDEIHPASLKKISEKVFACGIPFKEFGEGALAMELFHGPTLTVKDFGAQFMALLLGELREVRDRKIVLASSGNSAVAVASAFRHLPEAEIYVVCPRGSIRHRRHKVLSSFGKRVHILEMDGDIDRCNSIVRNFIAEERRIGHKNICGANSTNIARLYPEIVLYFYAYASLSKKIGETKAAKALYSIPSGNMTNLAAAIMARRMGLPMGQILAATTEVDALNSFLRGDIALKPRKSRYAKAMNIEHPTNLPRIVALCQANSNIEKEITLRRVSDSLIASTILDVKNRFGYSLDVHSAVSFAAAENLEAPLKITLATEHPSIALDAFTEITGSPVELPHQLTRLINGDLLPVIHLAPTVQALRKHIKNS